jgi:hypothetical protein
MIHIRESRCIASVCCVVVGRCAQFLSDCPFVLVGSLENDEHPWASLLVGQCMPFITVPNPVTVEIRAKLIAGDPLNQTLVKVSELAGAA